MRNSLGTTPIFIEKKWLAYSCFSVIYNKCGGGFVLELAHHPTGVLHTLRGSVVPQEEIDVSYAPQAPEHT
jgi:hypothetical protein